ncbi:unnamed protein product [Paramecium sonneborni]|uniref:Uncharacterized protein n=1 Tax=Paramecium sonneborni TaxID=65129 RepID=A0A8S1LWU7_9CILI|nr:unnamed protein product [Paramecium sonneborni]
MKNIYKMDRIVLQFCMRYSFYIERRCDGILDERQMFRFKQDKQKVIYDKLFLIFEQKQTQMLIRMDRESLGQNLNRWWKICINDQCD